MTKEAMIKVLRYKAEHIKTKIKPKFFAEVANVLKQEPCEDAISRAEAVRVASGYCHPSNIAKELAKLPSVQPKYNTSEWCHDCSEYDHDKHCCPRFNKVIRNTVEEIKQPKMGNWIYEERKRLINETDEGAEYVTDYWCKCSKCGGDFGYRKMKDAFCKYCGAKMVESQAENEEA